jgi:membrane-bound lytic murein transglycosylase A
MKSKLIYFTVALILIGLGISVWWYWAPKPVFRQVNFNQLPGWETADLKKSLMTFQTSCRAFIKQDPERVVGTDKIDLQAKDWHPACKAALKLNPGDEQSARLFFQEWFTPVEFYDYKPVKGLFTGYYMPSLKGSYKKTKEFSVPLYEVPSNLVTIDLGLFIPHLKNRKIVGRITGNKIVPFYTREQINKGAIKDTAKVLLWIHSPIDRLFLEIQGSGIVELEDGTRVYVGYDGQNGAPYTAIAGVLIKKGVMTRDNASMQAIKRYLEAHPKQIDKVINQNKSFIFFRKLSLDAALGSQGVALTPGYSLAIDREWIPMGAPLWLNTTRPDSKNPNINKPMQRLMIAQDTGGAIRGKVRGDVFWGGGDKATLIAGHMKNEGHYWLLLPRHTLPRLEKTA